MKEPITNPNPTTPNPTGAICAAVGVMVRIVCNDCILLVRSMKKNVEGSVQSGQEMERSKGLGFPTYVIRKHDTQAKPNMTCIVENPANITNQNGMQSMACSPV